MNDDCINIIPASLPKSLSFESFADHRVPMSLSLLKPYLELTLDDTDCVSKSFPGFWEELAKILASVTNRFEWL